MRPQAESARVVQRRARPIFRLLLALRHGIAGFLAAMALAAAAQTPSAPAIPNAPYGNEQLDQILAPVALYPDGLLAQILMAATYPLEIVQANRWLQDPAHANLRGAALAQAVQAENWDPSVRALVAFPQVLGALDNNLDWTEALGDAFVAEQAQVMDRIQQLRAKALAARTLNSDPQQVVDTSGQQIAIRPPAGDTVYVPEYDPTIVYGMWPYDDFPPDEFELPDFVPGGYVPFVIVVPLWIDTAWDWHRHSLTLWPGNAGTGIGPGPVHGPARRPLAWQHNILHRRGVPYRAEAAAQAAAPPARANAAVEAGVGRQAPRAAPGVRRAPGEGVVRVPAAPPAQVYRGNAEPKAHAEPQPVAPAVREKQRPAEGREAAQAPGEAHERR